ncbi:hypothetical protein BN2537_4433 [Streptomyces venezuelae]|nr:hypothetical protein BN2537_4433 [Streptomyces venezuelae]
MALQEHGDLLSEGLSPAAQDRTDQPSHPHPDHDLSAVDRHIPHRPAVIPVDPSRHHPAQRTGNGSVPGPSRNPDYLATVRHILDDQHRQPRKHRSHKRVRIMHAQ